MIDKTRSARAAKPRKCSFTLLAGAASLALLASCQTSDPGYNHWELQGLTPRIAYHLFSYDTNSGIPYHRHALAQRDSINLTLRRHLLNDNPENPFERDTAWIPPHREFTPLPNFVQYFHLTSLAFGSVLLGAGGAFIPFPYDAVPALFSEGGGEAFAEGFRHPFSSKTRLDRGPAPVEEFQVKNP